MRAFFSIIFICSFFTSTGMGHQMCWNKAGIKAEKSHCHNMEMEHRQVDSKKDHKKERLSKIEKSLQDCCQSLACCQYLIIPSITKNNVSTHFKDLEFSLSSSLRDYLPNIFRPPILG